MYYMDFEVEPGERYNYTIYALNDVDMGEGVTVTLTVSPKPEEPSNVAVVAERQLLAIGILLAFFAVSLVAMNWHRGKTE